MESSQGFRKSDSFVRSYDVFDTVLTRLVGRPESLFLLLGHRLVRLGYWAGDPAHFASVRSSVEHRVRRGTQLPEIVFREIYDEISRAHGISRQSVELMLNEEIAVEESLLIPVPAVRDDIAAYRQAGHRIVFISDMYLPLEVIRRWLIQLDVAAIGDAIYVSSQAGQTKSGGGLYQVIQSELGIVPSQWRHHGDNHWSDVQMAISNNIEACHIKDCHLSPSERLMEEHLHATAGFSTLFSGASRATRIADPRTAENKTVLNALAAEVAGPAIYAFVLWVIQKSMASGCRKIWFMARDGQVMIPVAREIALRLKLDIEVGYLFAGRQIVKVASLRTMDEAALSWITGGFGCTDLAGILDRIGLDLDSFRSLATQHQLPLNGLLGWECSLALRKFLQHEAVASAALNVAAQRREDVLTYLRHCGIIGGEACCIVDIGWRATVLKALDALIGRENTSTHEYLYFGLYARPPECQGLKMAGYLFDAIDGTLKGSGHDIPAITAVMETFCQADHGQVMRLQRTGDLFSPVCRDAADDHDSQWDISYFQSRVLAFAKAVAIELAPDPRSDLRDMVEHLLRQCLTEPSQAVARVLGSVNFVDDQGGSSPQKLARGYGFADLRAAYQQGARPWHGLNWWVPGAWALTAPGMRYLLRLAAKLGRLRRSR